MIARPERSEGAARQSVLDPAWAGPIVAVAVALWETRHAWGDRPPAGADTMALLIRTKFGLGHLLAHGHLDGWLPSFGLGYQEFLFYGPGMTWFIALVKVITLGLVSDAGAYKVVAVGSFCVFPLAVAWLARSMGLSRQGAGVAAVLSLLVDNPFGVGLEGIFENSLIAQQLAASLAFVVLGGVLRTLVAPRRRLTVLTAVAMALLLVTHIISTVILGLLVVLTLPAVWFTDRPSRVAWRELGLAALMATGGAAFWLVPLLAHRNLRGAVATWATPPLPQRLHDIWSGTYLFGPHIAEVVVAAWLFGLWRVTRNLRWSVPVLVLPAAYVLACRFLLHRYPANPFAIEIENRGIGLAAVVATFPLAELAARLAARLAGLARRLRPVGNVALLVGAGWLTAGTLGALAPVPAQLSVPTPATRAAAAELRRVVPAGARFVEVRQYPLDQQLTGVVHPDYWLAEMSGRPALNQFNPESSSSPAGFLAEHLLDHSPAFDVTALARLGVTDVVSTAPASTAYLTADAHFRRIWTKGPITILSLRPPRGQPSPASLVATDAPARASLLSWRPSRLSVAVQTTRPELATVALACTPKWHGTVDGRAVPLRTSSEGLCQLDVPAGASRIVLAYGPDVWDHLGVALSMASIVAVVGPWLWRRRSRPGGRVPRRRPLPAWLSGLRQRGARPAG